jgi:Ca2+-binding EF-hand superfamily protein
MRHLKHTTALAALLGAFAFAGPAQAQDGGSVCDTPWLQVDADNDGFVSQAEADGAVKNHFAMIDEDGDGNVTEVEYIDCLASADEVTAVEADRTEEDFAEADASGDGNIDRNEFSTAAEQAYEDSRQAAADDGYLVLRRYVWLVPEEASDDSVMQDMSMDEAASRSAMTFSALDTNDDGMVDTTEWINSQPTSDRGEEWAKARFNMFDGDRNGDVSMEEYRQALSSMVDDLTTASTTDESASSDAGETQETNASDASASAGDDKGIPVYIYRFWTM